MTTQTPASNSDARKRLEERKRMAASLGTVASNEGPRQSSSHAEPKYQELLKRRTEATEYTPTDLGVRWAYTSAMREVGAVPRPTFDAEFDRWLAAHDAEVAAKAKAEERERIAEAIEGLVEHGDGCQRGACNECDAIAEAVELARRDQP